VQTQKAQGDFLFLFVWIFETGSTERPFTNSPTKWPCFFVVPLFHLLQKKYVGDVEEKRGGQGGDEGWDGRLRDLLAKRSKCSSKSDMLANSNINNKQRMNGWYFVTSRVSTGQGVF